MNSRGINMFKSTLLNFQKISKIAIFLKMRKNLPVEKNRMFNVFPSRKGPFDFNKCAVVMLFIKKH